MTAAKVAVSLPPEVLARLEKVRRRTGRSRSSLVAEALEEWLDRAEPSEEDRRYVQGYLEHPESDEASGRLASAVMESWEPWE